MKLHRLAWAFSSCPEHEIPYLYCYEFSRESARLREWVEFMRNGHIDPPTYWTPNPGFGWPEWPTRPYLTTPAEERDRRLEILVGQQTSALDLLDLRAQLFSREGLNLPELYPALMRLPLPAPDDSRKGRAALESRYHNELRSLAVTRLREYHPAPAARRIYNNTYGQTYGSVDALEKTRRRFDQYLTAFILTAVDNASQGFWFPPFGPSLTLPS